MLQGPSGMWAWLRSVLAGGNGGWSATSTTDDAAAAVATIHSAAANGDACQLLDRLLLPHADVNLRDDQKSTALHLAAKNGKSDCVELLLRTEFGARLDLRDRWGRTPLHSAVVWYQLGVARQLLLSCERAIRIKDDEGKTVLHTACAMGLGESFLSELLKQGADVNALDMRQWTPLMSAIAVQNFTVAEFLLQKGGADANVPPPERAATTALRLAVEKCNYPLVRLLLKYGAKVDVDDASMAVSFRKDTSLAVGPRKKSDCKNMSTVSLSLITDAKPASVQIAIAIMHAGAAEPEWDALVKFYTQFLRHRPVMERQDLRCLVELCVAAGLDVSRQAIAKVQKRYNLTGEMDGWLLGLFASFRLKSLRHMASLAIRENVRNTCGKNLTSALHGAEQPFFLGDLISLRRY